MSRVQLAMNVADLDEAVAFYTKLFGTEPAKMRPGYANFAIADPPLKLVLIEDHTNEPGTLNHLGIEVASRQAVVDAVTAWSRGRRCRDCSRRRGRVLLRPARQGVGRRSGRRALGDLHRVGRHRDDRWSASFGGFRVHGLLRLASDLAATANTSCCD